MHIHYIHILKHILSTEKSFYTLKLNKLTDKNYKTQFKLSRYIIHYITEYHRLYYHV